MQAERFVFVSTTNVWCRNGISLGAVRGGFIDIHIGAGLQTFVPFSTLSERRWWVYANFWAGITAEVEHG